MWHTFQANNVFGAAIVDTGSGTSRLVGAIIAKYRKCSKEIFGDAEVIRCQVGLFNFNIGWASILVGTNVVHLHIMR